MLRKNIYGPMVAAGILATSLITLFHRSLNPDLAMFANDGPLGLVSAQYNRPPGAWTGVWNDLNWMGLNSGALGLSATTLIGWMLGPLHFIQWYPALALFALGMSAWIFARVAGFTQVPCLMTALAAGLNSGYFSYACWGLGSLAMCVAFAMLALAALHSTLQPDWVRYVLCGICVGLSITEGFDNGAILSVYIALCAWRLCPTLRTFGRLGMTVGASILVSWGILCTLVSGNLSTTVRLSAEDKWRFTTQWSMPPRELLRAIIPGLYGYRMDSPTPRGYWGTVGTDPAWDAYWEKPTRRVEEAPRAMMRYSGAGHFTGVLVVLLAVFAVAYTFHPHGVYSARERTMVRFWAVVALSGLALAMGRYAPFYSLVYAIPYVNTIRNPVKFLHVYNLAMIILMAYGVQGLWKGYIERRNK